MKITAPLCSGDLIQSEAFKNCPSKLAFAAGKDIGGRPVIADIAKMPSSSYRRSYRFGKFCMY